MTKPACMTDDEFTFYGGQNPCSECTRAFRKAMKASDMCDRDVVVASATAALTRSERLSIALRARWQDPEYRAKQLAKIRDPERVKRTSQAVKAAWSDPGRREDLIARNQSAESRRRRSESMKRWYAVKQGDAA